MPSCSKEVKLQNIKQGYRILNQESVLLKNKYLPTQPKQGMLRKYQSSLSIEPYQKKKKKRQGEDGTKRMLDSYYHPGESTNQLRLPKFTEADYEVIFERGGEGLVPPKERVRRERRDSRVAREKQQVMRGLCISQRQDGDTTGMTSVGEMLCML